MPEFGFEGRLADLRERIAALRESYRPFCMGVIEEVRRCLDSEAERVLDREGGAG